MAERLSDVDRRILALLQADGRRALADIGREVGLSTAAVKRRVDRLEASGVIRGYAAVIDAGRLGLGIEAIAEIYCAERTAPADVLATVQGIPEVVSAVTVSGEPDAVLRLQVGDVRHLERVIEALRRRPNVVRRARCSCCPCSSTADGAARLSAAQRARRTSGTASGRRRRSRRARA